MAKPDGLDRVEDPAVQDVLKRTTRRDIWTWGGNSDGRCRPGIPQPRTAHGPIETGPRERAHYKEKSPSCQRRLGRNSWRSGVFPRGGAPIQRAWRSFTSRGRDATKPDCDPKSAFRHIPTLSGDTVRGHLPSCSFGAPGRCGRFLQPPGRRDPAASEEPDDPVGAGRLPPVPGPTMFGDRPVAPDGRKPRRSPSPGLSFVVTSSDPNRRLSTPWCSW